MKKRTDKEMLTFLKRDRSAETDCFARKLNAVGLKIEYGAYSYWNHEPYVQIGSTRVYLVEGYTTDNGNYGLRWRKQNAVVADIKEAIKDEYAKAEKSNAIVKEFFDKLSA